ncbi:MAG: sigma-70 family RNA polymerase sigma factor [Pseudomonadota bacterium]
MQNTELSIVSRLLSELAVGKPLALAQLHDLYGDKVRRLALKLLHAPDMADDVTQDVFLALWQARDKWRQDGPARLGTWLYKVAVFKCADKRRQQLPSIANDIHDLQDVLPAPSPAPAMMMRDSLTKLLQDLPRQQQIAMHLHYTNDMDVDQIAKALGSTELAVRSLLKRAKQTLRQKLPGQLNDYLN